MAIVCEDLPETLISKEYLVEIQRAIGRLVDGLPEWGFIPSLVITYSAKGAAIIVCHDQETCDWLAGAVPTLGAWEGSKLKMVGLDALPTYKRCGMVSGSGGRRGEVFSASR
jgi:hypothetical protein